LPLGRTSRSFRRVGVARRHLGQKRLVASNSPKLSGGRIVKFYARTGEHGPSQRLGDAYLGISATLVTVDRSEMAFTIDRCAGAELHVDIALHDTVLVPCVIRQQRR